MSFETPVVLRERIATLFGWMPLTAVEGSVRRERSVGVLVFEYPRRSKGCATARIVTRLQAPNLQMAEY
jgi:hypothetical protein